MMKLDDRDIVCEQDYTPLSNAELVAHIERYAGLMHSTPLSDGEWLDDIIGPARVLMARAEAAEALAAERLEDALFAEQRATDAELERDGAILAASDAERHAENAMHGLAHFRARVAELEAQLAAQQWRPVTEKPVVTMQYQVVVQHSRQQPTADHMAYYPSSGWTGTDVIFWRPIPPLPPAPQETTQ